MKKPLHPVSDAALIHYLERVEGWDIETIRRAIGRKVDRAVDYGASGAVVGGFCYKLRDGVVTTVVRQNPPNKRTGGFQRRRDIDE